MNFVKENRILKLKKKNYLVWSALTLFVISNIYFALQTSTSGAVISQLESDAHKIEEENQRLSSEIIKLNSLRSFEEVAEGLGFIKPQKVIYITSDSTVAKVP